MPKTGATVESVDQIVDADLELEGIVTRPKHIRRWFTNNIFRRMFAYLVGWDGVHFRVIKTTEEGLLKTTESGSGYKDIEVDNGNSPDTNFLQFGFATPDPKVVVIQVWDNAMIVKLSRDLTNWTDDLELSADSVYTFPMLISGIKHKNKTAGSVARYEIWGYKEEV